jgi:uncharacterized protein
VRRDELIGELRRRIERLERRPPAPAGNGPRLPPGPFHGGAPTGGLADLGDAAVTPWGAVYHARLAAGARVGLVTLADAVDGSASVAQSLVGPCGSPTRLLGGLRVLDLETTGLSGGTGTLAFLIGIGRFEADGTLVVEQLLLGSPADERAMLRALLERLAGGTMLVTFNGRSFDVPLLLTRCLLAGLSPGPLATLPHLDVLAPARRLLRWRSEDGRHGTREEHLLRRRRAEDLPGALAPAAYGTFLRERDAGPLAHVVEHNRDDVCGTAALLVAALRVLADPLVWAEDAGELLGAAHHMATTVGPAAALPLVSRALELARVAALRRRALLLLATLQRRLGGTGAARVTWERFRAEFPRENRGHLEVAKHLEHRERDLEGALAAALAAPHPGAHDVFHRVGRLHRRLLRRRVPAAVNPSRQARPPEPEEPRSHGGMDRRREQPSFSSPGPEGRTS